jgi:hypothetical protein
VTSYSLSRCASPPLTRDAWISFRTNEFGKDEDLAIQLYTMLTAKSWRVFYAPICLPGTCCLGGRFFSCLRHFPEREMTHELSAAALANPPRRVRVRLVLHDPAAAVAARRKDEA